MEIRVHLPRKSEADLEPSLNRDLIITPKFYKKTGMVPVLYLTTTDARGNEDRYVLLISAGTKNLRTEKLIEVIPECDEEKPRRSKDGGQQSDEIVENEDVHGTTISDEE